MEATMTLRQFMNRYFQKLIFIVLMLNGNLLALTPPASDSLTVYTDGPHWEHLRHNVSYTCIANNPQIDTIINIAPRNSVNPEYLSPGMIEISGSPGKLIRLSFILPTRINGIVSAAGHADFSYTDKSAALIDPKTGEPSYWFNPAEAETLLIDSVGYTLVHIVADLVILDEEYEGDDFVGSGLATVEYVDSQITDSVTQEMEFSISSGLFVDSFFPPPIIWTGLRPGISYVCTTDTISNITPLDMENPEHLQPTIIGCSGAPASNILIRFFLPETLKPKTGNGFITMSYDSTSARVISTTDHSILPHIWLNVADSLVTSLDGRGKIQIFISGNPTVSSDALGGDTLNGYGIIAVEYSGFSKQSRYTNITPLQVMKDFEFLAIIRGTEVEISPGESDNTPTTFALFQNHPNPFNPVTRIRYQVPVQTEISLKIYNVLGMEVATLADGMVNAGTHEAEWNASGFPSGVYFYRLQAANFTEIKKLLLLK
jgi:hypothetical protein